MDIAPVNWETIDIAGRPADVRRPGPGPFPGAVIFLHGYGQDTLRNHPGFADALARCGLPVACPAGGRSWWLDRPAPDFAAQGSAAEYVRRDVVGWIEEHWHVAPPHIALLGVSMGGQGALNLAYRHAQQFPVVAALSPAIDFDRIYGRGFGIEDLFPDAEAARQETPVLHLHPLNWPKFQFFCSDPLDQTWHAGSQRLASKLASSGIPFDSDLDASHGGHGWTYFNAMADCVAEFLASSLAQL